MNIKPLLDELKSLRAENKRLSELAAFWKNDSEDWRKRAADYNEARLEAAYALGTLIFLTRYSTIKRHIYEDYKCLGGVQIDDVSGDYNLVVVAAGEKAYQQLYGRPKPKV